MVKLGWVIWSLLYWIFGLLYCVVRIFGLLLYCVVGMYNCDIYIINGKNENNEYLMMFFFYLS